MFLHISTSSRHYVLKIDVVVTAVPRFCICTQNVLELCSKITDHPSRENFWDTRSFLVYQIYQI